MSYTEELAARIMQKQKEGTIDTVLQIGVMSNSDRCEIGDLALEKDDFYIASHIKDHLVAGDMVAVAQVTEEKFLIIEKVVDP